MGTPKRGGFHGSKKNWKQRDLKYLCRKCRNRPSRKLKRGFRIFPRLLVRLTRTLSSSDTVSVVKQFSDIWKVCPSTKKWEVRPLWRAGFRLCILKPMKKKKLLVPVLQHRLFLRR